MTQKTNRVSLEELMVSTLAMTDCYGEADDEFKAQLSAERANYLAVMKRLQ